MLAVAQEAAAGVDDLFLLAASEALPLRQVTRQREERGWYWEMLDGVMVVVWGWQRRR